MGLSPSRAVADCEYLMARAETEIALADAAKSPFAAEAHHKLPVGYLERIFGVAGSGPSRRRSETEREKRAAIASAFRLLQQRLCEGASPEMGLTGLLAHIEQS